MNLCWDMSLIQILEIGIFEKDACWKMIDIRLIHSRRSCLGVQCIEKHGTVFWYFTIHLKESLLPPATHPPPYPHPPTHPPSYPPPTRPPTSVGGEYGGGWRGGAREVGGGRRMGAWENQPKVSGEPSAPRSFTRS